MTRFSTTTLARIAPGHLVALVLCTGCESGWIEAPEMRCDPSAPNASTYNLNTPGGKKLVQQFNEKKGREACAKAGKAYAGEVRCKDKHGQAKCE
jgi:hypothetical protein